MFERKCLLISLTCGLKTQVGDEEDETVDGEEGATNGRHPFPAGKVD